MKGIWLTNKEFSVMESLLFPFILEVGHFIYGIYLNLLMLINGSWSSLWRSVRNNAPGPNFKKLPRHVAFAFNEDDQKFEISSIENLIVWSIELGIQYMSLYDVNGIIKSKRKDLEKRLGNGIKWKMNYQSSHYEVEEEEEEEDYTIIEDDKKIYISLLCQNDGKSDIVRTARNIAKKLSKGKIQLKDINEDLISESLQTNQGLPDPDLLIRCGTAESNLGFLPWQIRLTEIHSLFSHRGVSKSDFIQIIDKYSKCQQRFGK